MAEALQKALCDLVVTNTNLEEIKDLCEELKDIVSKAEFENSYCDGITSEILVNYEEDSPNGIYGDLRCVNFTEGDVNDTGYYVHAEFEYRVRGSDPRRVYISYKQTLLEDYGMSIGGVFSLPSVEVDGPHFLPTQEEAPELYDDFLRWLVYQDFSEYVDI